MTTKIVYAYNAENDNVYLGEHVCQVNPKRRGEYLFPSNYSETKPGKISQNKNAFFNTTMKKWEIKDDYRGAEMYDTRTGQRTICKEFTLPAGYTLLPAGENDMWNGSKWIPDPEKMQTAVNEAAKTELIQIDIRSIRSIREWLVTQPNAPEMLKRHENEAKAERAKLK